MSGFSDVRDVTPAGLRTGAATLAGLIQFAYNIDNPDAQVSGLTDWMNSERWAVETRTAPNTPDLAKNLPIAREMTRRLLADRFQLRVQLSTRTLPIYELRLANKGPRQLSPATDTAAPHMLYSDGTGSFAEAMNMADMARVFSSVTHRVVVDETGLNGTYQFKVKTYSDAANRQTLSQTMLQLADALGLKLVSARAPEPILVVLSASRPQPN